MAIMRRDAVGTNIAGVQFKVINGTTALVGTSVNIPHGLDNSAIEGMVSSVESSATVKVGPMHTLSGNAFDYITTLDGANVVVESIGASIASKPIEILIWFRR